MGIFDRLSTLVKSNLNDLISSAENPEKMLNQIIVDMRNQLARAKQLVAAAIADEKRLKDQADAEAKLATDWEERAMLAVQQDRDDLAKQALLRSEEHKEHAVALGTTWQMHRAETDKLKQELRELHDKIEEAKRKKNLLLARARRAEAQARISQTMSGMSDKSAFEAFNRMEEKINTTERQLSAAREIDEEFSGDRLQSDFKQLERSAGAVGAEDRLLQLKQRMGKLPSGTTVTPRQLVAGQEGAAPAAAAAAPAQLSAGEEKAKTTAELDLIAEIEGLSEPKPRS
jgi:phage shock protein A